MTQKDETATLPFNQEGAEAFEKLAAEIARRAVFRERTLLPHNSVLYEVEKDWKSFMIKNGPKAEKVETLSDFEHALCDPGVEIIYVPATALISMEGIHRICARNAAAKIILKEVSDD